MSSKEKLAISSKKERDWLERESSNFNQMFERLRGKLLTTLEAAITNSKQLEALKSRVRDIQQLMWDRLEQDSYSIYSHRFTASDQPRTTQSPSEKEFKSVVDEFWFTLQKMIEIQFDRFKKVTLNLIVMAVDDSTKQGALKTEFERIINDSSLRLRNWLGNNVGIAIRGKTD